jgi:hypothetical protein
MAETFRSAKLEKFVIKMVERMEAQQRVIEGIRQLHGLEEADKLTAPIQYNQVAFYNYTVELCEAFDIKMPYVLGVTPKI